MCKNKTNGRLWKGPFLLSLELLDDAEFETNDVLGEDGLVTFISVEISCMHSNLQLVPNRIKGTIPLYFPDEFKSHFGMTRQAVHFHDHAHISHSLHTFLHYKY